MDVNLQNVYTEVLLDNFISVIKQNIMFQAQIEVMSKSLTEFDTVRKERDSSISEVFQLRQQLDKITNDFNIVKTTASQSENLATSSNILKADKDRLQSAVNDYMRQVKTSAAKIDELNKYIEKLESSLPQTKLKKLQTVDITEFQQEKIIDDATKNGGTF
jgi:predicted  nucleic acid-binding Zn-ribbon protein